MDIVKINEEAAWATKVMRRVAHSSGENPKERDNMAATKTAKSEEKYQQHISVSD